MTRVVVLGDVMVDVVARLVGPVAPGSDSPARVAFQGGGQAANTAAWLAVAGARVALVGRVGADAAGRDAVDELGALGVETRLAVDSERSTGTCVVVVAPDGERTMFPDAGANDACARDDRRCAVSGDVPAAQSNAAPARTARRIAWRCASPPQP